MATDPTDDTAKTAPLNLPTPAIKPGWKTTEFALTLVAKIVGFLLTSGILGAGTPAERVAGMAAMALGAFGYSVSRGSVKAAAAMPLLIACLLGLGASQLTACTAAQKAAAKKAGIACVYSDALPVVSDVAKDVNASDPAAALKSTALTVGEDVLACAVKIWVAVRDADTATAPATSRPTKGELAARQFIAGKDFQ